MSRAVHVSTTTHSSGTRSSRASLKWADENLLVPEADAGQLQVQDTVLIELPPGSEKDAYLLHVRHRDGRPHSRIQVAPYTSLAKGQRRSAAAPGQGTDAAASATPAADILTGAEGGWETLFTSSHLAIDQESLFRFKGHASQGQALAGGAVTLGLRVTWTVAHRHEDCPTWALALSLQKDTFVRRAATCPPAAGQRLPSKDLAVNTAGYAWEELDTWAPLASWPPRDSSCPPQEEEREGAGGESAARPCGHTADTSFTLSQPSLLQASLGFDDLLASYTLALIAVSASGDASTVLASSLPVFHSQDDAARPDTSMPPPLSTLSRVALSQELPEGKYVVRISRKNTLASSEAAAQAAAQCSPLQWRMAVSPLADAAPSAGGQGADAQAQDDQGQRPFVLDIDPPVRFPSPFNPASSALNPQS